MLTHCQSFAARVIRSLASLLALSLSACLPGYDELPSYRYRLTVEVQTPEGIRSGSSVIEVLTSQAGPNAIFDSGAAGTRENGEAVVIDLGERSPVFALLRADNFMDWPGVVSRSLLRPVPGDAFQARRAEIAGLKALRGARDVPRTFASGSTQFQNWPDLVRFADLSRPETLRWIGPMPSGKAAPDGIAIRRVTIEIVEAPVTRKLGRFLPWLGDPEAERRLPTNLDRAGLDFFIPPLSNLDFTRTAE